MLTEFALRLPPGWQVAMASRHALPLPVARLRLQGRLVGIGRAGPRDGPGRGGRAARRRRGWAPAGARGDLVERTEGWPIGLYFAGSGPAGPARPVDRGQPRRGETTSWATTCGPSCSTSSRAAEMSFLTRTSVLERMCGPLCDAIVGGAGSGRVLEQLERPQPAGRPARPPPRVVPLPPPVPGAAAGRAAPARARARPAAAHPGGRLARGERHARDEAIEHAQAGRRRRPGRPAGPRPDAAGLGQRAGRHGAALDGPGSSTRAQPSATRRSPCTAR